MSSQLPLEEKREVFLESGNHTGDWSLLIWKVWEESCGGRKAVQQRQNVPMN